MKITLKQMLAFDAVARLGSVSRAAHEISLSQSATSLALQDLESNLGVDLFDRQRKRMTLNDHGRRLRPKIHSVLLGAQEVESAAGSNRHQGELRIGAATTIGHYLLPRICSAFIRDNPGVRITLTVLPSREILNMVEDMTIDIGFIECPSLRGDLRVQKLVDDELVVFSTPGHRLAGRRPIQPGQLEDETWCLQPVHSVTRTTFGLAMLKHVNAIRVGFESSSLEAVKDAVMDGLGLGCQSRVAIRKELKSGTLRELKVRGVDLRRQFNIISRNDVQQSEVHAAFVREAMAAAPLIQQGRPIRAARA